VVFEDVTFAYEEKVVLEHVDFRLEPGDRLGLLGRTGGGKSTLTKLTARFYDPGSGCVRLAGVDLRNAEPDSVRSQISFITQDVQLFEGSVKQNIAFFDDSIPDERVVHALTEIGLGDWAATLEEGIHSPLGSGGAGMSAGEAQLVALARAYLRNPGLVILDEPSSRVDPATELLITLAIDRLTASRTAIIIAHRLDTVRHVDKIAVMAEGRLVEFGDRRALAEDPGSQFAALLEASSDGLLPGDEVRA
jgi:ABC-type multidrug transport system fused ATPase/permease subunit